ncbi:M12 family metallopeptidase [Paenibacillus peoriae]|uniref:M12 family metallopeptidase n=1 Tax=Paenibacillus peoriae TaxID=59893 RepID=UPI00096E9FD7|nr:M12 family metallopeptidase [Paenibacillus peoriae]OMF31939.1 Tolloid-like protein 1 [Paenibacillus peoriae]
MTVKQPFKSCIQRQVPSELAIEAARLAILENPENNPKPVNNNGEINNFKMAMQIRKKWRNGRTLRVRFLDGDSVIHEKIKKYANEWSQYANIKFNFNNDSNAEIRISFQDPQGGYWSYVGTDNLSIPLNEATMNFEGFNQQTEEPLIKRVVLHEFGHCIGVSHEQSNPSANIPWDKDATYTFYARIGWSKEMVDHNVLSKLDPAGVAFTPHDKFSIMQYPVDNECTRGDYEIGWNYELSETDKQFISQMYPDVSNIHAEEIEDTVIAAAALHSNPQSSSSLEQF